LIVTNHNPFESDIADFAPENVRDPNWRCSKRTCKVARGPSLGQPKETKKVAALGCPCEDLLDSITVFIGSHLLSRRMQAARGIAPGPAAENISGQDIVAVN